MEKESKGIINHGDVTNQTNVNIETMHGNYYEARKPLTTADFFRELFIYLESKRVLYYGCESESPERCTESVLEVKRDLKDRIQRRGLSDSELCPINEMLEACNAYLDLIDNQRNCGNRCLLKAALIALRNGFRSAVQEVETNYGMKFRHEILPPCNIGAEYGDIYQPSAVPSRRIQQSGALESVGGGFDCAPTIRERKLSITKEEAAKRWLSVEQGKWYWDKNKEDKCYNVYNDFLKGWWLSFVPEMLDKLDIILSSTNTYPYFFFGEIREKYGSCRIHFFFDDIPETVISSEKLKEIEREIRNLFVYYTGVSYKVCAICGESATVCTYPWEGYYCNDCKPLFDGKDTMEYRSLETKDFNIRWGCKD